VDPNFAPMYATRSRKVKTDKRDARTLAKACKLGAYRPAHRTSDARRHLTARLAVREALVRTRAKYISLARALVRREGVPIGTGEAEHFAKRVNAAKLPGHLMAEVAPLLVVMQHLNAQIAFLDGWLERVAAGFPQQCGQVLPHRLVQHRPLWLPSPVRPPVRSHLPLPSYTSPGHTLPSTSHRPRGAPGCLWGSGPTRASYSSPALKAAGSIAAASISGNTAALPQ